METLWIVSSLLGIVTSQAARGTAFVSGMAELDCNFRNSKQMPFENLRFSWQIEQTLVHYVEYGKVDVRNVNERYKNRSMTLKTNGDLLMYNITLEDANNYKCYVFTRKEWSVKEHESDFVLQVFANFSEPEIPSSPMRVEKGETVNIHCSSQHGFPKPKKMFWIVSEENATYTLDSRFIISAEEKTFKISSNVSRTVHCNMNVSCIVEAHHNATSKVLQIEISEIIPTQTPDDKNPTVTIVAIATISFFMGLICLVIYMIKRKTTGVSNENNAEVEVKMETCREMQNSAPPEEDCLIYNHETVTGS